MKFFVRNSDPSEVGVMAGKHWVAHSEYCYRNGSHLAVFYDPTFVPIFNQLYRQVTRQEILQSSSTPKMFVNLVESIFTEELECLLSRESKANP